MDGTNITARLGATVRHLRFHLGLSQEALAARAELHRTYIAGIEAGARNVTLKSIDKLARALEVTAGALLTRAGESDDPAAGRPRIALGGEVVDNLLVEDNRRDVELTLEAFQHAKITNPVHVVSDGAEALDFLFCERRYTHRKTAHRPQLVLLDLYLPKVSGIEVLRRIKRDERTRSIPVVVLTASHQDRDIAECRHYAADTHIVKPVDFNSLTHATTKLSFHWALLEKPR